MPDTPVSWQRLTGGISSDIWRVTTGQRTLCVKCALPKLRVAQDWEVSPVRNAYEWAWMNFVHARNPAIVPQPLAQDAELGAFAMAYLDPDQHPVWKSQLMQGQVRPAFADQVARELGQLHAASARDTAIPAAFPTDDLFYALRLEPYLVATATVHPDLAAGLHAIVANTLQSHKALVHGDVSPKNILAGPTGPVFLDAECAWFGDPAFDLAFCLNHLMLKCVARPDAQELLRQSFDAFCHAYLDQVDWEAPDALEHRAARLLPALFLARVDGKSPVEYVVTQAQKQSVRTTARALILHPVPRLADVADHWWCA